MESTITPRGNRHFQNPITLEEWNDINGIDLNAKGKIRIIFKDSDDWFVMNPTGDGFCGLYTIKLAFDFQSKSALHSEYLIHPTKEALIKNIISGIKIYVTTRKLIINDLFKYSIDNARESGVNISLEDIQQISSTPYNMTLREKNTLRWKRQDIKAKLINFSKNRNITIQLISMLQAMINLFTIPIGNRTFILDIDDPTHFFIDGVQKTLNYEELKILRDEPNVDTFFLFFLAYHYQHNFIILFYDFAAKKEVDRLLCASVTFINYEIEHVFDEYGSSDIKHDKMIYNSRNFTNAVSNTSLMFNNGHFILFHNSDLNVKEKLIKKFLLRDPEVNGIWGLFTNFGPTVELITGPLAGKKKQKTKNRGKNRGKKQTFKRRQRQSRQQTQRIRQISKK
jgi:hypothetical protein